MAVIRCDFRSTVQEQATSMLVVAPEEPAPEGGFPVLYLLHGLSDDATAWLRQTRLERHLEGTGLLVVMPQVHRSYYTDEAHGSDYWTFLTDELPDRVAGMFNVSAQRSHTFVAGLSMGGYGAFKWALHQPHRFAAAASLSGALGIAQRTIHGRSVGALDARIWDAVFDGADVTGGDADLLWLLRRATPASLPALYSSCGTDDALYPENVAFAEAALECGIELLVEDGPGEHTWDYWDAYLSRVLQWLPLPRRMAGAGARQVYDSRPARRALT